MRHDAISASQRTFFSFIPAVSPSGSLSIATVQGSLMISLPVCFESGRPWHSPTARVHFGRLMTFRDAFNDSKVTEASKASRED